MRVFVDVVTAHTHEAKKKKGGEGAATHYNYYDGAMAE